MCGGKWRYPGRGIRRLLYGGIESTYRRPFGTEQTWTRPRARDAHRGAIDRRGVLAPEDAIDPDPFFDALAPHCAPPIESGEKLILVTTSG